MDFIKVLSIFILLAFYATMIKAEEEEEAQPADCKIKPTNVDKVEVVVYINGDTYYDITWLSRYESWMLGGFPYDDYAPVTIKVGAEITCDDNNVCNCPNYDSDKVDCTATFQNVCAQQILGDEEYTKLLFCSIFLTDRENEKRKGFQACVDEQSGLAEEIAACMKKEGDECPQAIALKNAQEVIDAGVNVSGNTEPFFFYNGIFDTCISDDSPVWFLQKICAMLKYDIAKDIASCGRAMGSDWLNAAGISKK